MKLSVLCLAVLPLTLLVGCAADTTSDEDLSEGSESELVQKNLNKSVYTTLQRDKCLSELKEGEFGMPWADSYCGGIGGYVVRIVEMDSRDYVSIMKDKNDTDIENVKATGGGFSYVGNTAEWRTSGTGTTPFALIFRQHQDVYNETGDIEKTSSLVVTKLEGEPCIIKVIDATKHKDANALARAAADHASITKCPKTVPQPE